jgi:hypothetical protein
MSITKITEKYDKVGKGVIIGLTLPILGFFIAYLVLAKPHDISLHSFFFNHLLHTPEKKSIIGFSMLPNMFLFYFVNFRWNMYDFTKGIVGVTLIMGIIVVISSL